MAGSWYRQCAFSKILSGSRPCDASAQTDPVQFAKAQEKKHKKSSALDELAGAPAAGGISEQVRRGGSKAADVDSDSDEEKQENRYT